MKNIVIVAAAMLLVSSAKAQQTYQELEQITVNEQVTTLVTASEPILFVDVSTDKVAGDKPIENTVRFKPKDAEHTDGEVLAIATIVTERYRTQYALVYTTKMTEAVTDKEIAPYERTAYRNPAVSLSTEDMTKFARRVWNSPAKIHNVKAFSVDNRTNIRFDIDELRVKLVDKKVQKATNNQTIELPLALVLDHSRSFLHGYRNVIVFKKMTFPNDKVVTIELSEKQISGRAISISVDYEDVLSADAFDRVLLEEE